MDFIDLQFGPFSKILRRMVDIVIGTNCLPYVLPWRLSRDSNTGKVS